MKVILSVIGTRPEAIKLAPVLKALSSHSRLKSQVCVTNQHTDLLAPFLADLKIEVDYLLEAEKKITTLADSSSHILNRFASILIQAKPNLVLVQGDTTTAFATALAAFYTQIPVAHVESGLRTGNLQAPWPEEAHRCMIAQIATYAFAPTQEAKNRLLAEGVSPQKIWVVGNTSIDAVRMTYTPSSNSREVQKRTIVVTIHRRENQGDALKEICAALRTIAQKFADVNILTLLHPNPEIREPLKHLLADIANISLLLPMSHLEFLKLMDESLFVMTDSGGVQEEVAALGKPLIILRKSTERPEGLQAGTSLLVGTERSEIIAVCQELLQNATLRTCMSKKHDAYGDGYAAERIAQILNDVVLAYE